MTTSEWAEHKFGGGWTEIKLNAVSDYLNFFTRALQASPSPENPFETWYVDAFAGTGDRTIETNAGSLFSVEEGTLDRVRLEGSARRAIAVDPPFRHLIFIEKDARRFAALERVRRDHPPRDIRCVPGDANDEIRHIFSQGPWCEPARRGLQRAVVFLDPYGMSVRWDTLQFLAQTSRADVWYLFPLHAALRQLSHDHAALDPSKRAALNVVFGTPDWEDRFYEHRPTQTNLFDFADAATPSRVADADKVERFAAERLRTIFSFVSEPIPILTRHKLRQFSLFLLSGNSNARAIALIKRGVAAQIKKYSGRS
ncbi:MAG: three-Cys-motif partner protein TcmP [Novosphingobium sp.]